MFDPHKIKKDFPILETEIRGKPVIYFDNAATTFKPKAVTDHLTTFYNRSYSNVHRGIYALSMKATAEYEDSREKVRSFINAGDGSEIVFTSGTTESINLVAYSWGEENIQEGDEIVISIMEHHSNLIPWQQVCLKKGAVLKFIPLTDDYTLDLSTLEKIITEKTKLVAITQVSNTLGTIVPLAPIIRAAKSVGALTLVDGAQGVPHFSIDVRNLDCDFLAFSAHKMLGPTGVGILYGKREIMEKMMPFKYGGEMIKEVSKNKSVWNDLPYKFEAGTPNIAGAAAFKSAIEYLENIGMDNVLKHDRDLKNYAYEKLKSYPKIKIYSPKNENESSGILSFNIEGVHPHDITSILDSEGVAVRAGNHCAQPLVASLNENSTVRLSFYIYNTRGEIDQMVNALEKVYEIFKIS